MIYRPQGLAKAVGLKDAVLPISQRFDVESQEVRGAAGAALVSPARRSSVSFKNTSSSHHRRLSLTTGLTPRPRLSELRARPQSVTAPALPRAATKEEEASEEAAGERARRRATVPPSVPVAIAQTCGMCVSSCPSASSAGGSAASASTSTSPSRSPGVPRSWTPIERQDASASALLERGSSHRMHTMGSVGGSKFSHGHGSHDRHLAVMMSVADEGVQHDSEEEEDNDELRTATTQFNKRHVKESGAARGLLTSFAMSQGGTVDVASTAGAGHGAGVSVTAIDSKKFLHHVNEVRRNRLVVAESYNPFEDPIAAKPRRHRHRDKRWHLHESIWHPRKLYGNSGDYFETEEAIGALFEIDWHLAVTSHGLSKEIIRLDLDTKGSHHLVDLDGNGVHDAIDRATAVLQAKAGLLYTAFDYYACLSLEVRDEHGEINIYSINYNAYREFARDCGLVNEWCKGSDIDLVWVQVNSLSLTVGEEIDRFNHRHQMVRHEFIQSLVRIAMITYLWSGQSTSVADACSKLLAKMEQTLPPEARQDANAFRRNVCYLELVDLELRKHEATLRAIFDIYSRFNTNRHDALVSSRVMSVGEWSAPEPRNARRAGPSAALTVLNAPTEAAAHRACDAGSPS